MGSLWGPESPYKGSIRVFMEHAYWVTTHNDLIKGSIIGVALW
jgi:hypothetical protein